MVSAVIFVGSDFGGEIEGGCGMIQGPMRSTAMVVHGGVLLFPALALVKLARSAELDEIVGVTAEIFPIKVLLDGFEESICYRMQKYLVIPLN